MLLVLGLKIRRMVILWEEWFVKLGQYCSTLSPIGLSVVKHQSSALSLYAYSLYPLLCILLEVYHPSANLYILLSSVTFLVITNITTITIVTIITYLTKITNMTYITIMLNPKPLFHWINYINPNTFYHYFSRNIF